MLAGGSKSYRRPLEPRGSKWATTLIRSLGLPNLSLSWPAVFLSSWSPQTISSVRLLSPARYTRTVQAGLDLRTAAFAISGPPCTPRLRAAGPWTLQPTCSKEDDGHGWSISRPARSPTEENYR